MSHDFDVVTGPTAAPPPKSERDKPREPSPRPGTGPDRMTAPPPAQP